MKWLPSPQEFRTRLAAIQQSESAEERLEQLGSLANTNLSFLEVMQVDAALAKTRRGANSRFDTVRLAVLATSTVDHLLPWIRAAGLRRGLRIEIYVSGYAQYRQELLDPTSQLHAFRPDAVLFALVGKEFVGVVPLAASASEADQAIDAAVQDLRGLWKRAQNEF